MAFKSIVLISALVAVGQSSVQHVDADVSSFAYDVADPNTGDYKSQVETRSGGVVKGQYSLVDPDGTRRVVDYTADDVNGFNAVVRKEPLVAINHGVVAASPAVNGHAVVGAHAASVSAVLAPPVVAARTIAAPAYYSYASPAVISRSYAIPSVYSSPSVYPAQPVYSGSEYSVPSIYNSLSPVYPSYEYRAVPFNHL